MRAKAPPSPQEDRVSLSMVVLHDHPNIAGGGGVSSPSPSRPVPSRLSHALADPLLLLPCLSLRSVDRKKTKQKRKNPVRGTSRSIYRSAQQALWRSRARGDSGGKSRHGVVQAQPVRAGVARSLQGKVAVRSLTPSVALGLPSRSARRLASTPVLSYSVYTLTDATERSIGVFGVVVVVVLQTGALLTYLFCEFFSDNFVVNFVVLSLFLACDFWTVSDSNLQPLSLFLSLRSKPSDDFC